MIRKGRLVELHHNFLQVGDIISIEYGMTIPVDGLVIVGTQLQANESAMTGESDELRKDTLEVCAQRREEKIKEGV